MAKSTPFHTTSHSIFAYRPKEFGVGQTVSVKTTLTNYCLKKGISKDRARTLIKKRWLSVTKSGRNLWVQEICPEAIEAWLSR